MPADRLQLYQYRGNCCAQCGVTVQEMIDRFGGFERLFELHHVDPLKKAKNYKNLIRRAISTEQLDEVDKCVLLCTICHGAIHQQDCSVEVLVRVTAGNRRIERRYKGQLLRDYTARTCTFLTDADVLLHPYRVSLQDEPPKIIFGHELNEGGLFSLLDDVRSGKTLSISNWRNKPVFCVKHEAGQFHVQQDISFRVVTCELSKEKNDPVFLWIRKGMGLTRDGEVLHDGELNYTCKSL